MQCSPKDPVPAKLLASNTETFVPFWVDAINLSLETGSMDGLKVLPVIKELNASTDLGNLKNYRPVSNLQFIGKVIERILVSSIFASL